eukprot:TRINITY_DN1689_c0_g1_i1.p1 TRINITY_DN1689_c0_g1~~TRINITY_DN1689_c0_g1_i1.p1  ORF type:complete len:178 (-),score=29.36 TRINITY_DN1689_c0_g1_i1:57-590(-)
MNGRQPSAYGQVYDANAVAPPPGHHDGNPAFAQPGMVPHAPPGLAPPPQLEYHQQVYHQPAPAQPVYHQPVAPVHIVQQTAPPQTVVVVTGPTGDPVQLSTLWAWTLFAMIFCCPAFCWCCSCSNLSNASSANNNQNYASAKRLKGDAKRYLIATFICGFLLYAFVVTMNIIVHVID